jgi:hypothetical protein
MKKLLFFFSFLLVSHNIFSQESFLGKSVEEIYYLNSSHRCYENFKIGSNKSLHVLIDDNTIDIYIFNDNNICVEYDHIISNCSPEKISSLLSSNYIKNGDYFQSYDNQYSAQIQQIAALSFKIRFVKRSY